VVDLKDINMPEKLHAENDPIDEPPPVDELQTYYSKDSDSDSEKENEIKMKMRMRVMMTGEGYSKRCPT
jgi:hypothetical protein